MSPGGAGSTRRAWVVGIVAGVLALAALVYGSTHGSLKTGNLHKQLIAWMSAAVLLVFGAIASTRTAHALSRSVALSPVPSAGAAVRITTAAVGYLVVFFGELAVLDVPVEKILVGAGLAGVVLGIAAQQSLGNMFAGLVLVLAKPFRVGDHLRVRSGALGGVFDAWVRDMSLTYVTLELDTGEMKIPNSAMLSAGVGRVPPGTPLPPALSPAPSPVPSPVAAPVVVPPATPAATPPASPPATPPATPPDQASP